MAPGKSIDWMPVDIELITFLVTSWNGLKYKGSEPGPGDHDAHAIRSGHDAIEEIDKAVRSLHALRETLVDELRADADARNARVDAMLAERRADR